MSRNKISDISVLENLELENLNHLDLSDNEIMDITVLFYLKLKKLKRLDIFSNKYDKEKNKNLILELEKIYRGIY